MVATAPQLNPQPGITELPLDVLHRRRQALRPTRALLPQAGEENDVRFELFSQARSHSGTV